MQCGLESCRECREEIRDNEVFFRGDAAMPGHESAGKTKQLLSKKTLPETNSLPPKLGPPKRRVSSSNHQFSGAMLVSGRVIDVIDYFGLVSKLDKEDRKLPGFGVLSLFSDVRPTDRHSCIDSTNSIGTAEGKSELKNDEKKWTFAVNGGGYTTQLYREYNKPL